MRATSANRSQMVMRLEMFQPGVAYAGPPEEVLEELVHPRKVAQSSVSDAGAGEVEVPQSTDDRQVCNAGVTDFRPVEPQVL
jgi:hypothetical protein